MSNHATTGPAYIRFATLILSEKGIAGLLSIGLAIFICYLLLVKMDGQTDLLRGILAQQQVTNCILSGNIEGGCNVSRLFGAVEPPKISDAFFTGTIGGDGIAKKQ